MLPGTTRRALRITSAILLVSALAFAQVAAQLGSAIAAPITVECCCGEHGAEIDCGCLDCPGSVYRGEIEQDHRGDGTDRIRPCGQTGDQLAPTAPPIDWNLADSPAPPGDRARAAVGPPAGPMPPSFEPLPPCAPS